MKIKPNDLRELIKNIVTQKTSNVERAYIISEKIVLNELMSAETHGVHYFLRSIYPFLDSNEIELNFDVSNAVIKGDNKIIEGIYFSSKIISLGSEVAHRNGISLILIKNPGKVGALRSYCIDIITKGQSILIFKNTAPSISQNNSRLTGTNPLCIGIGGSKFILDMSTSTVATNKLRLLQKENKLAPNSIGLDSNQKVTNDPEKILDGGDLLPFSFGDFWYKSFFLGLSIELLAAVAGGKTGSRVGSGTGSRFESEEGLMAIIIDNHKQSDNSSVINEIELMLNDARKVGIRIPGEYDYIMDLDILEEDLLQLKRLLK